MAPRIRTAMRAVLALGGLYALAVALGLGLMVLAFRLGVLGRLDILFYRGVVIILGVFVVLLVGLAVALARLDLAGLSSRDAIAAAILSLSLNLSFLVVVPVTVDRSISIFVLGQMAAHPDEAFAPDEMSALFTRVYVGDYHQIDRRLREQAVSGNVEKIADGYRISPRGQLVIAVAKVVATLFDSHAGLVAPHDISTASQGVVLASTPLPAAP